MPIREQMAKAVEALNQRDFDGAAARLQMPIPPLATGVTVADGAVTLAPAPGDKGTRDGAMISHSKPHSLSLRCRP